MTPTWESMSKDELVRVLRTRDGNAERELHDLRLHQAELETELAELRSSRTLLEESRARYAALYDFAPIAFCTVDTAGRVLEANLAASAFLGVERSALIGKPLGALLAAEDRALLHRHFEQCIITKGRVTTEVALSVKGMGRVPFQMVSTALIDDLDRVTGCKTALTDVSALKRSEERLGLLASASAILSSSFDATDTIAQMVRKLPPHFADLCFADVLEEDGQVNRVEVALSDALKPELGQGLRRAPIPWLGLREASLHDPPHEVMRTLVADTPERESVVLDLKLQSLMLIPIVARERVFGLIGLGLTGQRRYGPADLTFGVDLATRAAMAVDNARLYQKAQRAVQARQEVLSIVSHDLKNPLAGIALSADTLLYGTPTSERRRGRRHVERIRRSATQMRRIIDDLLDLGSIDAGQLAIERNDENLEAMVEEALEVLTPLAQDKGVALNFKPIGPPLWASCDKNRTQQVLSNLIGNAIKYTQPGGKVDVETAATAGAVCVRVRDTGPGMTRAELRHLFERYWRAKRSASTQGRGLGLFISKRLVEAQGGAITVESELGVGTTACFTLPQGTRPQLPRREARAAVLVVEDEDGLRDVLQDLLLDNAYDVTAVPNGRLALEALRSGRLQYSLILLDVRLPEMDGRELLQHLREDPAFAAIPVVLVSGVEPLEELLRLGTAGCLKKPLDFNTVLAMVGTTAQPRP